MRRALLMAALTALLAAAVAAPLAAQPAASVSARPPVGFLTDYTFHLAAARLAAGGERFEWDTDLGGEVDLVDYGFGRLNFLASFEAILGRERGPFDPNQGNYTLDVMATWRRGHAEVGAVFHHVSRHLSDRAKSFPIDWNMAGVQMVQQVTRRRVGVAASARWLGATKRSFVDYRSELGGEAAARVALTTRLALIIAGGFTVRHVVPDVFDRRTLVGGRAESGVRLTGRGGALELFLAVERRIDADAIERLPRSWALAGFRILSE